MFLYNCVCYDLYCLQVIVLGEIVNILLVDEVGEETNHNPVKIKGKLHLAKTLTTPLPLDFLSILK